MEKAEKVSKSLKEVRQNLTDANSASSSLTNLSESHKVLKAARVLEERKRIYKTSRRVFPYYVESSADAGRRILYNPQSVASSFEITLPRLIREIFVRFLSHSEHEQAPRSRP